MKKHFIDYFSDDDIIFYLCKIRTKIAKQRNKKHLLHLLTGSENFNYHKNEKCSEYEKQLQNDLNKILPSRRKWKNLGEESRIKRGTNQKLNSLDKNLSSLLKTVKHYRRKEKTEPFVINLNQFIEDIKNSVQSPDYKISLPIIYPKPKKKSSELKQGEKNICRPITLFNLKDRLILSFTNKYLTELFDEYFEDYSLAFRAVTLENGQKKIVSHHTAIQKIIAYKNKNPNNPLWVAECDMQKFYDSVNHKIIKTHFEELIKKVKNYYPEINIDMPHNIFLKYLSCYSFNCNVLKLNDMKLVDSQKYWEGYKIVNGEFGWINNEPLFEKFYPEPIENERIGVPQGGALSGLIANIVLDKADKQFIGSDVFYIRFCDDMILMHPEKEICENNILIYEDILENLKLFPHNFCSPDDLTKHKIRKNHSKLKNITLSTFWKHKSKSAYCWNTVENNGFPWIGFVGYEIHMNGDIRVRKSSFEKELQKQDEVIADVRRAIKDKKRVADGMIKESVINRLIGMSVGRVELWNYDEIETDMCWKKGFQELNNNKNTIRQLKQLDKSRNKLYRKLSTELASEEKLEEENKENEIKKTPSRQIIDYNKPFSYYYQVLERKK
ncbi:MAG: reverse transcriptase domain-containing protein [Methylococcales bacterium]